MHFGFFYWSMEQPHRNVAAGSSATPKPKAAGKVAVRSSSRFRPAGQMHAPAVSSNLLSQASDLAKHLERMLPSLQHDRHTSIVAVQSLLSALDGDFDLKQMRDLRQRPPQRLDRTQRSWQLAVNHRRRKKVAAQSHLQTALAEKVSGRIAHIWIVLVGLADPAIPAATLEHVCREFGMVEKQEVSSSYIGTIRDSIC